MGGAGWEMLVAASIRRTRLPSFGRVLCGQTTKEPQGGQQDAAERKGKEVRVATKSLRIDAVAAVGLGLSRR